MNNIAVNGINGSNVQIMNSNFNGQGQHSSINQSLINIADNI
jgi:hypothetical protein